MYLGIDLGTSGVKAVLLCERGRIVQQTSAPLEVSRRIRSGPNSRRRLGGRPRSWLWLGLTPHSRARVRGIGLAGQMHDVVLLDRQDRVLRPAILWNDGLSQAQCAELEAREPAPTSITGNPCLAGFTPPKLLWVRENKPDIFGRHDHVDGTG